MLCKGPQSTAPATKHEKQNKFKKNEEKYRNIFATYNICNIRLRDTLTPLDKSEQVDPNGQDGALGSWFGKRHLEKEDTGNTGQKYGEHARTNINVVVTSYAVLSVCVFTSWWLISSTEGS